MTENEEDIFTLKTHQDHMTEPCQFTIQFRFFGAAERTNFDFCASLQPSNGVVCHWQRKRFPQLVMLFLTVPYGNSWTCLS